MNDQPFDMALDRDLRDLFGAGPATAPSETLERGLARAAAVSQRRPRIARLDRQAWPPQRRSLSDPSVRGFVRVAALAIVLLVVAAAVAVGARLLDRPPSLVLQPAGTLSALVQDGGLELWPDGRLLALDQYLFDLDTGVTERLDVAGAPGAEPSVHPLLDGRAILVFPPEASGPSAGQRLQVAVLDMATGAVTAAGELPPSAWQRAELVLRDGRILVTGGLDMSSSGIGDTYAKAAIFDPATGGARELPPLLRARFQHSMLELPDGRVLIAGGQGQMDSADRLVRDVELLDLETGTSQIVGRFEPQAGPFWTRLVLLATGRVLILGATTLLEPCPSPAPPSGSAPGLPSIHAISRIRTFVFDPAAATVQEGALVPYFWTQPVALEGERVLVYGQDHAFPGGCAGDKPIAFPWLGVLDVGSGDLYTTQNPVTGEGAIDLVPATSYSGSVRLPDGRVALIEAGGDLPAQPRIDVLTID